jgi:hypothetical protein
VVDRVENPIAQWDSSASMHSLAFNFSQTHGGWASCKTEEDLNV